MKDSRGKYFRWVVPRLEIPNVQSFKLDLLDRLKSSKTAKKGLEVYSIAVQTHADGCYHLDLLLTFTKRVTLRFDELDFLCAKHGQLTKYRSLNSSILAYNFKQDTPLTNISSINQVLDLIELKKDPYLYLYNKMILDPFGFKLEQYVRTNSFSEHVKNWSSIKLKLKDMQVASANLELRSKPGIRYIDRALIQTRLTSDQLRLYDSWSGYARIVQFLNHIPTYGTRRPTHTPNLFIHGRPRIGKTSLIQAIQTCTSVYPVGTQNWFPKFSNHVYRLMFWDQCRLNMMAWQQMLILLDGRPYDLPFKGGSTLKHDNQLWILNSNKSVKTHLKQKHSWLQQDFDDPFQENVIQTSFRKRVVQVSVPNDYDLFLLLKLVVPS